MNVLEKILVEIEERIKKVKEADYMCRVNAERNRNFESVKYFQSLMFATERAESIIGDIIRSHMDEAKDINVNNADAPYITLTLNEDGVAEVYDDTYDVTVHCESEEEQERVVGILERYQGWIPVEEVCKMLKDMQIKVLKCQGFFDGHISQVWAVDHLLGEKLEALGGVGVQKEHDKDTGETRYVWES